MAARYAQRIIHIDDPAEPPRVLIDISHARREVTFLSYNIPGASIAEVIDATSRCHERDAAQVRLLSSVPYVGSVGDEMTDAA